MLTTLAKFPLFARLHALGVYAGGRLRRCGGRAALLSVLLVAGLLMGAKGPESRSAAQASIRSDTAEAASYLKDSPVMDRAMLLASLDQPADAARDRMTTDPAPDGPPDLASPAAAMMTPTLVPIRGPRAIEMEVTAYCACKKCCGPKAKGITASGRPVSYNRGRFAAADTRLLAFGSKLVIPGYAGGKPVEVIDRGSAIKGNRLDVYFASHEQAKKWGRKTLVVTVLE